MTDFVLSLLDVCLIPFTHIDNLLLFVPCVFLTVCFLFRLISSLIRGYYS